MWPCTGCKKSPLLVILMKLHKKNRSQETIEASFSTTTITRFELMSVRLLCQFQHRPSHLKHRRKIVPLASWVAVIASLLLQRLVILTPEPVGSGRNTLVHFSVESVPLRDLDSNSSPVVATNVCFCVQQSGCAD